MMAFWFCAIVPATETCHVRRAVREKNPSGKTKKMSMSE